jgi:hypothetical protein
MKPKSTISVLMLLAGLLAVPGPVAAEGKKPEPINVRQLLEKGQAAGSLPDGMVIRISACLGESDENPAGNGIPDELRETWEFTSKQVHRVEREYDKDKSTYYYRRIESHPFDSKSLCKELLDGKALEIQAKKGKGPEIGFSGTRYHRGSRNIEVEWNGEVVLELFETNGPFLQLYRESDARAFGTLYERLASQARILFKSEPAKAE